MDNAILPILVKLITLMAYYICHNDGKNSM